MPPVDPRAALPRGEGATVGGDGPVSPPYKSAALSTMGSPAGGRRCRRHRSSSAEGHDAACGIDDGVQVVEWRLVRHRRRGRRWTPAWVTQAPARTSAEAAAVSGAHGGTTARPCCNNSPAWHPSRSSGSRRRPGWHRPSEEGSCRDPSILSSCQTHPPQTHPPQTHPRSRVVAPSDCLPAGAFRPRRGATPAPPPSRSPSTHPRFLVLLVKHRLANRSQYRSDKIQPLPLRASRS